MRSSGHLKSNLISFWEMNKIANVRITVNPRAQRSRGRHDPRCQLLSQKACWAFLAAQSDVGMGKKRACVVCAEDRDHSTRFSLCQEATMVQDCATTEAISLPGGGSQVTREDRTHPGGLNHPLRTQPHHPGHRQILKLSS